MMRREAISLLLGAGAAASARTPKPLARWMGATQGAALLVDIRTRQLIAIHNAETALAALAPPGSTLKPIVLAALLRLRRLTPSESFPCPGELTILGHRLTCSHPPAGAPMRVETAIAYSCNCFAAHMASRFAPGELAAELERAGLGSAGARFGGNAAAGRIRPAATVDATRLQALGEDGMLITAAGLAQAYRILALDAPEAVLAGLDGAVEYGTAQRVRVEGWTVAGKTGTAVGPSNSRIAWFAGFAPSRAPEVAIAVMAHGRSGGADAAPAAGRILEAFRAGKL
jgi:penicillin-binding protein 2